MKKMSKKCSADLRFIWKRNTAQKIHTLVSSDRTDCRTISSKAITIHFFINTTNPNFELEIPKNNLMDVLIFIFFKTNLEFDQKYGPKTVVCEYIIHFCFTNRVLKKCLKSKF